jgi:hypothetical protein
MHIGHEIDMMVDMGIHLIWRPHDLNKERSWGGRLCADRSWWRHDQARRMRLHKHFAHQGTRCGVIGASRSIRIDKNEEGITVMVTGREKKIEQ